MNLEFENYWELLALHKSLMAVKFDDESCLPEAQGSPFTSSLAFKIFDLLVLFSRQNGKDEQAEDWLAWQKADLTRRESTFLLKQIEGADWWLKATESQRLKYVKEFMAPLVLKEEALNEIIKKC